MKPQDISTAPRDGAPILTNEGVVKWRWDTKQFVLCTPDHYARRGSDNQFFRVIPRLWMPLPDWMR